MNRKVYDEIYMVTCIIHNLNILSSILQEMSEIEWNTVVSNIQELCSIDSGLRKLVSLEGLSKDELISLREKIKANTLSLNRAKKLVKLTQESINKKPTKKVNRKMGKSFHTSKFNPLEPIIIGSEVAYKLKNRHTEEWIQCEVMKVDGTKFEIRDPEPDENNNPGQTFKVNYKEILLIPTLEDAKLLVNYSYNTKVLARYPETTTFYTANVVGHVKGMVKLIFDGEEEVNKETVIERRLVLPLP